MNGDIVLNGTLVLPEGYTRTTLVLIMVTGSGQQNRDEEIFEHKPFAVIADALARAGIATLRYDDRGFSGYEGNINDCTTEDFKNDALAGVELLRTRFDKVGVIGHSEGGTIALMLGNITCPILALNGTKDVQVNHESNLSALRNCLPAKENNCIESVDGVNHLFQHCKTGAVTEYRDIEETILPAVLETIIDWISRIQS